MIKNPDILEVSRQYHKEIKDIKAGLPFDIKILLNRNPAISRKYYQTEDILVSKFQLTKTQARILMNDQLRREQVRQSDRDEQSLIDLQNPMSRFKGIYLLFSYFAV